MKQNKRALYESIMNKVSKIVKESLGGYDEPQEVSDGIWVSELKFEGDGGELRIHIDECEEYPDGDSFVIDFTIDKDLIDAEVNSRYVGDRVSKTSRTLARRVHLYYGVQFDYETETAIKMYIVQGYFESEE